MPIGAGVEDEALTRLSAVSSADLRGVFRPAITMACDSPALPHSVGRTVFRCSRHAELREPLRYNEEGLGRRTVAPETACRTGPARSRRPVEAVDATDDDFAGHEACQLLRHR